MRYDKGPTLREVAEEAGVHIMAAAVVLNGSRSTARVSDATRTRILDAALRLRYMPRTTPSGRCDTAMGSIGILLEKREWNLHSHEMLNSILECAAENLQSVCIFLVRTWNLDAEPHIREFCRGNGRKLICVAPDFGHAELPRACRSLPTVMIQSSTSVRSAHHIACDDEGGSYEAVRFLISLGHRRIAYFPGELHLASSRRRLDGYRRALAVAGIPGDESLVHAPGSGTYKSGRDRMLALLERREALPTAVACGNDAIASGCMDILAQWGISVPERVSVVGYDDALTAQFTHPPLTTVRQPLRRMGEAAIHRLCNSSPRNQAACLVSGQFASDVTSCIKGNKEVFKADLIIRNSVGPPCATDAR